MKIKVAFGQWVEDPALRPTPVALTDDDPTSCLAEKYSEAVAEHSREWGDVREIWLHVPDDVIERLFSVPTVDAETVNRCG